MASVEDLSDGEIRVKLTELGYPVGPITATTRKVLLKKLKYLLDQSKFLGNEKKDSKNRQSLLRYSSAEESEDDSVSSNARNRKSMPPPSPKTTQKTVKRRSMSRRTQEEEGSIVDDITVNSDFLTYPTASSTLNSTDIHNSHSLKYSPKNIVLPSNHSTSPNNKENHKYDGFTSFTQSKSRRTGRKTEVDPFDTGSDTDGIDEVESNNLMSAKTSPNRSSYSSLIPSLSSGLSQTRLRFQTQAGLGLISSTSDSSKYPMKSETNSHPSPFSSDFAKRLSTSSSTSKSGGNAGLPSRLFDVKESDDEDINSTRSYPTHQSTGHLKRGQISQLKGTFWKNIFTKSRVLLFIVAIFFCGLGALYLNMHFKEAPITSEDLAVPICKVGKGEKPGGNCILSSEVHPTINMFKQLHKVLYEKAVKLVCGSGDGSSAMTEEQITQMLVVESGMSVWDIEKHFGNIKVLIKANPQLGVEVIDKEFNIPSPTLPLGCYVFSFFYGIIGSAVRLILAGIAVLGVVKLVYWWLDRQERSQKEVFKLVESIIDVLSTHQQSSAGDNYLAISHVRDQLIPPQQRDKMASVWEKAVAYLEENESRVRTEVQQMMGEEFRVWRWLPAPRSNGKRKVWQGQAFETMEGSVNSLPISPTPCLKIRHMFDLDIEVGDEWMTRVQDAILEKCEGVNVLHVAVDKTSTEGCVYVKCASPHDAGRAYRALHGSWFDSKLVTVKYLRLERYHERFPEAVRSLKPLRPSNDRKLSLQ